MDITDGLAYLKTIENNTLQRTKERRQSRIARNTPESWRKLWEDALRKWYPECLIAYSDRTAVHLKRTVEKYGLPRDDMPSFIPWVVEHWHGLRVAVFSLNGKAYGPATPDMKWVVRHVAQIHAYFTSLKPDVAATLPIAQRNGAAAPKPLPPQRPAVKTAPRPASASIQRPLIAPLRIDHAKARAVQDRLNLPKWD